MNTATSHHVFMFISWLKISSKLTIFFRQFSTKIFDYRRPDDRICNCIHDHNTVVTLAIWRQAKDYILIIAQYSCLKIYYSQLEWVSWRKKRKKFSSRVYFKIMFYECYISVCMMYVKTVIYCTYKIIMWIVHRDRDIKFRRLDKS